MSEKARKEKLGRNPFEQRKSTRKPRGYEEPAREGVERSEQNAQALPASAKPVEAGSANRVGLQNPLLGNPPQLSGVPVTATLAWLCVDFWASSFFEPMFFWMNSPKIARETMKAASGC